MTEPTNADVLERAFQVFAHNNALSLATAGGAYSPWILGAYFVHDGPDLLLFLETHGKSLANVAEKAQVAFSVSENDAMKDFVQGRGEARVLPPGDAETVLRAMTTKMPWFKLYTPSTPVRIRTQELFVSSFASQWFPAKRWAA
jgi:nitroimidazol reductase NimA-like FMN-containing flavoprotein (pyridoxamine 5'-phosphate oxidase superfamily)